MEQVREIRDLCDAYEGPSAIEQREIARLIDKVPDLCHAIEVLAAAVEAECGNCDPTFADECKGCPVDKAYILINAGLTS
jgi:hypothetical protein